MTLQNVFVRWMERHYHRAEHQSITLIPGRYKIFLEEKVLCFQLENIL